MLMALSFWLKKVSVHIKYNQVLYLPGDNRNMENIIRLKTAAITRSAIKIPRQFRRSGDMATSSCKDKKKSIYFLFFSLSLHE